MEKRTNNRGKGAKPLQAESPDIAVNGTEDTGSNEGQDATRPRTATDWRTVASKLFKISSDSVAEGVLLSQVVGNFSSMPEEGYFKNDFGIGCSIVADEEAEAITLIYQDGTQKTL